jgi:hypothetical protein
MIKAIARRRTFLQTFGLTCTSSVLTFGMAASHAAVRISMSIVRNESSLECPLYIADKKASSLRMESRPI